MSFYQAHSPFLLDSLEKVKLQSYRGSVTRMRAKFITIFLLFFGVFAAALLWRVDQLFSMSRLDWNELQSRAQMSALSQALSSEIQSLQDSIILGFPTLKSQGKSEYSESKLAYTRFQMVGEIIDGKLGKVFFRKNSPVTPWGAQYTTLALQALGLKKIPLNGSWVVALQDPSRKPFVLVVFRAQKSNEEGTGSVDLWYAGVIGADVFQALIDKQKGQMSQVFIVNPLGQAVGHTTPEYIGSNLSEDPLVKEIMQSQMASGSGLFSDLSAAQVQGFYEQVDRSNVYVAVTTPLGAFVKERQAQLLQMGLMALGLCFVGIAFFLLFYKPEKEIVRVVEKAPPAPPVVVPEKMESYTRVASALNHELRGPLTAILGHAQLVKSYLTSSPESAQSFLEKIEEEARYGREILGKLATFSGEKPSKMMEASINQAIGKVLKKLQARMNSKGVKVTQQLEDVGDFKMAPEYFMKALEALLMNSIESMERAPKKEITIQLSRQGTEIELKVMDTGEGVDPQIRSKILDPFFTTKNSRDHLGMGLPMVLGIVREMGGSLDIESEKGKGCTVVIRLRPHEELASLQAAKTAWRSLLLLPAAPPPCLLLCMASSHWS
ncbi:MAG: ATP-binding protein, partial [Proteobacteria bacterium]|nr:ATP-binding protein [Pseudomonadota bacterium]